MMTALRSGLGHLAAGVGHWGIVRRGCSPMLHALPPTYPCSALPRTLIILTATLLFPHHRPCCYVLPHAPPPWLRHAPNHTPAWAIPASMPCLTPHPPLRPPFRTAHPDTPPPLHLPCEQGPWAGRQGGGGQSAGCWQGARAGAAVHPHRVHAAQEPRLVPLPAAPAPCPMSLTIWRHACPAMRGSILGMNDHVGRSDSCSSCCPSNLAKMPEALGARVAGHQLRAPDCLTPPLGSLPRRR